MGATVKAIRDNRLRAAAIGINANAKISIVYTVAAGLAGCCGRFDGPNERALRHSIFLHSIALLMSCSCWSLAAWVGYMAASWVPLALSP
jgi:ABC-type branched-subunit amino acid transport system permease subunit